MAREYIISAAGVTLANQAVSLIFFQVMTAAPVVAIEVLRVVANQSANATSAQQRVQLSTQVSTWPTLTSMTPGRTKAGDPVSLITGGTAGAAGTCGVNASAEGAGTKTVLLPDAFNVLNGYLWVATPKETFIETPAATAHGFGVVFPTAPATLTLWNAYMVYAELG